MGTYSVDGVQVRQGSAASYRRPPGHRHVVPRTNVDESGCLARHQDRALTLHSRRVVHAPRIPEDSLYDDSDHARAAPHG